MPRYTSPTSIAALASHVPQPALQAISEAAASRISLLPRPTNRSGGISAVSGASRSRLGAFTPPTDEEIEAALADARQSDPLGQNDDFYYQGYQSREDVTEASDAPLQRQGEGFDNEPRLYYHSVDNTWRVYPPSFGFSEVSDDEVEDSTVTRERKRDKLKKLGAQLFKRVLALRKKK